jgi:hypothetical protein
LAVAARLASSKPPAKQVNPPLTRLKYWRKATAPTMIARGMAVLSIRADYPEHAPVMMTLFAAPGARQTLQLMIATPARRR